MTVGTMRADGAMPCWQVHLRTAVWLPPARCIDGAAALTHACVTFALSCPEPCNRHRFVGSRAEGALSDSLHLQLAGAWCALKQLQRK